MARIMTRRTRGWLIFCSLALAAGLFVMRAAGQHQQGAKQGPAGLTAEQVIASVKTAAAAKPGSVLELEAERERGKLVCEVEILAEDGKKYEVVVDVANNSVAEIEEEDDDDDDDDDNGNDNRR
jgi:hypothetical protein